MSAAAHDAVVVASSVLTPLGCALDSLWARISAGERCAFVERAARLPDFDASAYISARGMRLYDRPLQLAICAGHLAQSAAGTRVRPDERGVLLAAGKAHVPTLLAYDRGIVANGIRATNPALMPLALPSSPVSASALALEAQACAVGLAGGAPAALDACALAARFVASGRVAQALVIGSFTPHPELIDARPHGEAAGALVMMTRARADAEGRPVLARILAHAARFDAHTVAHALHAAIAAVLARCHASPGDLAWVVGGGHRAEAEALQSAGVRCPSLSVDLALGECEEASGVLRACLATHAAPAQRGLRLVTAVSSLGLASVLLLEAA